MLGSLKKLFFKDTGEDLATSIPEPVAVPSNVEWAKTPSKPVEEPDSPEPAPAAFDGNVNGAPHELLALPLQPIVARLPNSLASVVQSQGNGFVSLPTARIVQELSKGLVKIPFGELRKATAPGTFFDVAKHDLVLIELPLEEILARLKPSLLPRRADQKQIHIPEEITNIFGPHGEGISLSTAPMTAPKQTAPASTGDTALSARGDTSTIRRDTTMFMRNAPAAAPAPATHSSPTAVVSRLQVVKSDTETVPSEPIVIPVRLISETWPELVQVEMRELNLTNASVALPLQPLGEALRTGKILFTWKQIAAWMKPPVEIISGAQDLQVELPLKIIAPLFMARHRSKAQKKVTVAEIPDLFSQKPAGVSEQEAESSKPIAPPVQPAPASAPTVAPAPIVLPTPAASLPVRPATPITPVAPSLPASTPIVPKVALPKLEPLPKLEMKAENITPFPKPVETKAPVVAAAPLVPATPVAPVISKQPETIGEIFGQPGKTNWPPAEVLKNLVKIPGIAGGFVAMTDGLLVAAELPSHLKAETVAAFLPQIFGRMNQYTKELQLGGLSSLTFVAENISWQLIKSGGVYLVALSQPGGSLPSANLNLIARELGKQIQ